MASSYRTSTDEKPALEHGTTFEALHAFEDLVEQLSPAGAVPEPAQARNRHRTAYRLAGLAGSSG